MFIKKIVLVFVLHCFVIIANSQTADEVINKYIEFIGGVQKWKVVKTITTTGIYNYGGMEFPYKAYSKAPDRYKYVVTSNGKSFTQAYDGKIGWRIDGFKNETKKLILKNKQATALANEADVELESPFINYRQKGHSVALLGLDTANNRQCYKIRMVKKDGDTVTYFFDNKDFSLVKKQAISKNSEMDRALMDVIYSNYNETAGIKIPYRIAYSSDGQKILTITVESLKLNLPMAESMFKP